MLPSPLSGRLAMAVSAVQQPARDGTRSHEKYERLVATAKALPRLAVAVVHPCDGPSLGGALEAANLGLIEPILVGPKRKIEAAAAALGSDLSGTRIVDAPHSH